MNRGHLFIVGGVVFRVCVVEAKGCTWSGAAIVTNPHRSQPFVWPGTGHLAGMRCMWLWSENVTQKDYTETDTTPAKLKVRGVSGVRKERVE